MQSVAVNSINFLKNVNNNIIVVIFVVMTKAFLACLETLWQAKFRIVRRLLSL